MITETQLRRYFSTAMSQKGVATGTALLQLLERRLDAVGISVYFALCLTFNTELYPLNF